jgi:hypothetical protein
VLIGKIKIDAARMLSDADADHPLGSIKLRARLKQIERRPIAAAPAAEPVAS